MLIFDCGSAIVLVRLMGEEHDLLSVTVLFEATKRGFRFKCKNKILLRFNFFLFNIKLAILNEKIYKAFIFTKYRRRDLHYYYPIN